MIVLNFHRFYWFKGTESGIKSDPPCQMTMPDLQWYVCNLYLINNENFDSDNSSMFFWSRNAQISFVEKPKLKIISLLNCKHWYIIHTWSDKALKYNVV